MQFSLALEDEPVLPKIRDRLLSVFGRQRDDGHLDPVSQFVNAMISTQTRDEVSLAAFERLRKRYPSWNDLRDAAAADIEPILRPVINAKEKSRDLPRALRMIVARSGDLNLDFLADWEEEVALHWLKGLPGVGPKIAATVLNFSTLGQRALAVDRHLLRVGKRLGLLSPKTAYERGHEKFMRLVPDEWGADDLYEFHWLMKYHSQRICTHTAPACADCRLSDLCPSRMSG